MAAAKGEDSAAIAERWLGLQPEGVLVVRAEDDDVRGFIALLDLTAASDQELRGDPGALAASDQAHRAVRRDRGSGAPERFVVDRETYQEPSPTLNAVPIVTLQRYLSEPRLAWDS